MNMRHVLFFCFFSALCGGNTRLVSAKLHIYSGVEGQTGTVTCSFHRDKKMKFFCKNECKAEDILIKTDGVSARSGRYRIEYRSRSSGNILAVTVTNLTKSDSGRYKCGLGKTLIEDIYMDLEIRVSDAELLAEKSGLIRTAIEGEEFSGKCSNTVYRKQKFLCKDICGKQEDILIETEDNQAQNGRYSIKYEKRYASGLYITITGVTKSDAGRYRCGYGRASSPVSYKDIQFIVMTASVPSASTPISTQNQSSSSGSFPPSLSPGTRNHFTGYLLPLVIGGTSVSVLLAVSLLWKTRRTSGGGGHTDDTHMEAAVTYENMAPASTCEDHIYENLHPASRDRDQTYCTLKDGKKI